MVKFLACLLLICKVGWYRQENCILYSNVHKQTVFVDIDCHLFSSILLLDIVSLVLTYFFYSI